MKNLFLFVFIIPGLHLHGQETTWDKMLKLYSSSTSYSMDFNISMNVKNESEAVKYSGSIRRSGSNYYCSIQGMINVYGPKYWVMVQEKEKTIYYGPNDKETKDNFVMDQKQFADSLLKKTTKPVLKSKNASEEVYSYTMKEGVYASVDYYIGTATGYLDKVIYNYRQTEEISYQQVTITYSAVSVNQPVADSWFSEKSYISIKGKQAIGIGRYIHYSVIEFKTLIPTE